MHSFNRVETGQGLVEYALILVLVSVVSVAVLALPGTQINVMLCQTIVTLSDEPVEACETDTVAILKAEHHGPSKQIRVQATSDGGYNPDAALTATVNGYTAVMTHQAGKDYYEVNIKGIDIATCPCTVSVDSTLGGSASKQTVAK